jgi:hypothetical protein
MNFFIFYFLCIHKFFYSFVYCAIHLFIHWLIGVYDMLKNHLLDSIIIIHFFSFTHYYRDITIIFLVHISFIIIIYYWGVYCNRILIKSSLLSFFLYERWVQCDTCSKWRSLPDFVDEAGWQSSVIYNNLNNLNNPNTP